MNPHLFFRSRRQLLLVLLLAFSSIATAQDKEAPFLTGIDPPRSILFVGNSFTFYNNAIYTHLRKLLVSHDPSTRKNIFLKSMTISGATLADHQGGLIQLLDSRDWDVVVLQGQSRALIDDSTAAGFKSTARDYSETIRTRGAEPVLFMTWAYADQPNMTTQLASEFKHLGSKLNVMVVPVGLAFAMAIKEIPGVVLHDPDNRHPSLEGTYLAAAVFYASLYRRSPVSLAYAAGLDEKMARQLRQIAWKTVIEYFPAK
jgi:hypothetical protein